MKTNRLWRRVQSMLSPSFYPANEGNIPYHCHLFMSLRLSDVTVDSGDHSLCVVCSCYSALRLMVAPGGSQRATRRPLPSGLRRQIIFGFARRKTSTVVVWLLLAIAVLTLTLVNIAISVRLGYFGGDVLPGNDTRFHDVTCSARNGSGDSRFVRVAGRFDNSRRYRIHDYVHVAEEWLGTTRLVCLATQTSVDRMHLIGEVSRSWQGLVSVAVFVPRDDFPVAERFIEYLRKCEPLVRSLVSFHFLYPLQHAPVALPSMNAKLLSCDMSAAAALRKLLSLRPRSSWRNALLYPQNHLRNVARKGCASPYVFLTDVDVVPRDGLGEALHSFLEYPVCDYCAFVVPTYELDERVAVPHNKSELLQLVRYKKAQPFHQVVFINNQFATNFSLWERLPEGDAVHVAYPVTNFELFYEPFYVARDDVPSHDERFIGYGFTRNTQVYEMFVANFKFLVLNYAFAVHRGLKQKKTRNSWRERQNRANSRLFKKFEREVLARYGSGKH